MGGLIAAAIIIAATVFAAGPTYADTATNLKCKGCVGARDIGKKSIGSAKIRNNAIDTKHLKDGSVTPDKLSTPAQPSAASNFYTTSLAVYGPGSDITLMTDTVNVPGDGNLVVMASWRWIFNTDEGSYCSITLDSEDFSVERGIRSSSTVGSSLTQSPASMTTVFKDVAAGQHVVRLVCATDGGDEVSMFERGMTTMFVRGQL